MPVNSYHGIQLVEGPQVGFEEGRAVGIGGRWGTFFVVLKTDL
jgi:hypothetical protein